MSFFELDDQAEYQEDYHEDHINHKNDHDHNHKHDHDHDDDCVCKVVKKIHKAQEAAKQMDCRVSCEKSIQQLLSPTGKAPKANTIPFTLDCACESFIGKAPIYDSHGHFCTLFSPYFKVKKVDDNCCAILELLWPTCDDTPFSGKFTDNKKNSFPCFDFNGFIETGACINVDLKCFCSISCHKPTKTKEATPCQIRQILKAQKHSR